MNAYHLPVDAGLSVLALEHARQRFIEESDEPRLLFCHTDCYSDAVDIAIEAFGTGKECPSIIADENAPREWWLLLGERTMVWSCP